jgi:glycosyltransferase involved in cell wall biosynthesis
VETDFGPVVRTPVRHASRLDREATGDHPPAVLVLAPSPALGGAEQTLYANPSALGRCFRFPIATLAPSRTTLCDRRGDFPAITERILCLGDLVHPDAMPGMLLALLDAVGAEVLYNANGTTLFSDFAPRLKAARPGLRIIDHFYDHEVGYIGRYRPGLEAAVDVCIAANNSITEVLVGERGWPAERVPVIWPCGRPRDALPPERDRDRLRVSPRHRPGYGDDDVVALTAARMHPQKRLQDLVALADRVRDVHSLHFLLIVAADVGCLVSDHEGVPVFLLECL